MILAENLNDFLKYAQRKVVIFDDNESGREEENDTKDNPFLNTWEKQTMFDEDAVAFLNEKVPLSTLRDAA